MEKLKIEFKRYDLNLRHKFTISRGSRDTVPVIVVRFEKDGIVAYGEASPNARYNETADTVQEFLKKIDLEKLSDPSRLEEINNYLDSISSGNSSAKCAIDIAMHDWVGKKLGIPLYEFFGIDKIDPTISSFTIGIDTPDAVVRKVEEAANYPVLKVKVGFSDDEETIRAVRSATGKPLRVDANEGWKSKEEALEKIRWLTTQNVEFVEQPLPAEEIDDARWLRERVSEGSTSQKMPIVADEALSLYDVAKLSTAYDGINIKLQKNGGFFKARKLIHEARKNKMKVMLGCMIETSIGITAATHLSTLADWNDLDGNVLISNDPFKGVVNQNGRLLLNDEPGLGIKPN